MKIIKKTLPHGGTIYYAKNKLTKINLLDVQFECGAREDTIPGISHFVEHMFFTGTDKLSRSEVWKAYFDYPYSNASTSDSRIEFNTTIISKKVKDYFATVADIITHSTFSDQAIENEKKVVIQEIVRGKSNHNKNFNYFCNYNKYRQPHYKNHNIGNEKSVNSIKRKDIVDYVNKWFNAENLIVFVVSPMPFGKIKKYVIEQLESKLPSVKGFVPLEQYYPPIVCKDYYEIAPDDVKKTYININFNFNRNFHEVEYRAKANFILQMMNDESEGILKKLRLEKNLVYGAGFSINYTSENSEVIFGTNCSLDNVNEVIKSVAEYLKGILEQGFTQKQLDKIKDKHQYEKDAEEPSTGSYLRKLFNLLKYGKDINFKKLNEKTLKTITIEECNAMFKEIFEHPVVSASIFGDVDKSKIMTKREFNKLFKFTK